MSLVTAKDLRGRRARLVEETKAMLAAAAAETRDLTPEETVKFDAIHADIEKLLGDVTRIERQDSLEREMATSRGALSLETTAASVSVDEAETRKLAHADAFRAYILRGAVGLTEGQRTVLAEYRAQSVGTTTAGGFLVPQGFSGKLEESLQAFGGMRAVATVFPTNSGSDLPWPTTNDNAQTGELLAENTGIAVQDVVFGQITFKAYKYSSKLVAVSTELLQDSAFNLDTVLAPMLGTRLGRITNTHYTVGTGSAQPQGAAAGASVGTTGTTGQTVSVIYNDLVDLEHSVDPAYRNGARWMFRDSTLKAIKKLVDSTGRPLWSAGLAVKEPDTISGYPYTINQDVAAMAANAKSILFGAFSKYMIRDVAGIAVRRLDERYAELGQVGFIAFMRTDGRVLDAGTDPIKAYVNSAT